MIDFLKYRPWCAAFSALIFITFFGLAFYRYQTRGSVFNYSVDFTGGTQILLKFDKPITDSTLKEVLEAKGWNNPVMRDFSPNEILVRMQIGQKDSDDVQNLGENVLHSLQEALPDNPAQILQIESIGSSMGSLIRTQSIWAIVLSLILMLIYIGWRFWSFAFAAGAVVALFHDAIVILLVFLILDKEISINVIGAILAVLGYSVNDTIVIFSRIRDLLKTTPRSIPVEKVVNDALNLTLRRTVLTSFATMLVVISLITLGGETLRDLSLALLVGIIFGTYSSIYMASPVMLALYKEKR